MPSHIPNVAASRNSQIASINSNFIPDSRDAVFQYRQGGGSITEPSTFGIDPIADSSEKKACSTVQCLY